MDDVHTALQRDEVLEFQEHLNSIEPFIKFTMELESDCKLAFLYRYPTSRTWRHCMGKCHGGSGFPAEFKTVLLESWYIKNKGNLVMNREIGILPEVYRNII